MSEPPRVEKSLNPKVNLQKEKQRIEIKQKLDEYQ
jgi:hypothetical protein